MTTARMPLRAEHTSIVDARGMSVAVVGGSDASLARLFSAAPELLDFARAALLLYAAGPWTDEHRAEWRKLTGRDEATTKALGDFARVVLAKVEGKS